MKQGDRFPTTHWTLVGRAGDGTSEGAVAAALSELLTRYRPALRAQWTRLRSELRRKTEWSPASRR